MNFVPAAAVIRGGQALFKITGRKEHVGGFFSVFLRIPLLFIFTGIFLCPLKKKNGITKKAYYIVFIVGCWLLVVFYNNQQPQPYAR